MLQCEEGDDIHEYMHSLGWSDGLPLVPPTPQRVRLMLSGTRQEPHSVLGQCPPMYGNATIEKIAANAVMAGCAPPHFRIVLAAVKAMLSDDFNLHGVSATTMGATPVVIVNGPARHEAGLNYQHGALGSGTRANGAIGRALKLVLQNIGGAKLGGTESTTLGTPMKWGMCVAEWEEAAPAWEPYHVTRGFNRGDSTVPDAQPDPHRHTSP